MMEWIDCTKEKPLPLESVLLYIQDDQTCYVGWQRKKDDYYHVGGWEKCYYCGGESKVYLIGEVPEYEEHNGYIKIASHWMKLPERPEIKEDD